jgi:hypothetical protein
MKAVYAAGNKATVLLRSSQQETDAKKAGAVQRFHVIK